MGGYGAGDAKLQDSFDFDMFLGSEDSPLPSRVRINMILHNSFINNAGFICRHPVNVYLLHPSIYHLLKYYMSQRSRL